MLLIFLKKMHFTPFRDVRGVWDVECREEKTMENDTNKGSSKNRRTLQRRAADLMMEGLPAAEIAARLGVRFDTVVRWQRSQAFGDRIKLHKAALHQEIVLDVARVMRESSRYVVENPDGRLGNTMGMLRQIAEISQLTDKPK
jgi:hypothetical protein